MNFEEEEEEELEGLNQEEYDDLLHQIYQKYNLKMKEKNSNEGMVIKVGDKSLTEEERNKYFLSLGEGKKLNPEEIIFVPLPKGEKLKAREKFHEMEKTQKEEERKEKERILEQLRVNSKNIGKTKKKNFKQENFIIYAPVNKKQKSIDSNPVTIQIRLLDSTRLNAIFQTDDLLTEICTYIIQMMTNHGNDINSDYTSGLTLSIFKKMYTLEELEKTTIKEAGLSPRGIVYVIKEIKGFKTEKNQSYNIIYDKVIVPKYQLIGESKEEKEKFKQKMEIQKEEKKKLEKEEEKKQREKIMYEINEKKKSSMHLPTSKTKEIKKELTEKQRKKKELERIRAQMKQNQKEKNEK
eukprot:gene7143-11456_t